MYIIAGLGNPGSAYKWTRHNAGFEVIGKLAYDHNIGMTARKFRAVTGTGSICGQKVRLAMPMTYMNLSGESLRDMLSFYDVPPERLIVVYDDTDLPVGGVRVREKGGAGGHNGMKSLIYQLDTDVFPRVRVGIGAKPEGWELSDYVLSKFRTDEREDIIQGITLAGDAVCAVLRDGILTAMNTYNRRGGMCPPEEV
ncbi:MAG: aminoacyl-tRNA hydrolase [Defluviitaleaceae bacterium]|nr:aminoacyl-tRNA hydrolase [Defluviitaleaceae bacterium]MCL2836258.1 aminoacyl-tRNA hydrolase [Defluviitaleaceae bacterium]